MSRYIDSDAIDYQHHKQHRNRGNFNTELLRDAKTLEDAFYQGVLYVHKCIEETPTADVRENVHGEWILDKDISGDRYGRCSECGMIQYVGHLNYCPNCGADMRGEL